MKTEIRVINELGGISYKEDSAYYYVRGGEGSSPLYAELIAGDHGKVEPFKVVKITDEYILEQEVVMLQSKKSALISGLNESIKSAIIINLPAYPDFEKLTFEIQKSEARAWNVDNTLSTPNVDILALNRGVDREVILSKINIKADQFEKITMAIAGQRQKFQDLINKATTLEELDEINISFTI